MTYYPYALLGVAVVAVGARFYWSKIRRRFARVSDGVYRSGALPEKTLRRRVRQHGIRTVVDLRSRESVIAAERATLASLGVAHVNVPTKQRPSPAEGDRVLDALRDAERPVLVHCSHGAGRAPHMSALYLFEVEKRPRAEAVQIACWPSPRMKRRVTLFLAAYEAAARERGSDAADRADRGAARPAIEHTDVRTRSTYHDWLGPCMLAAVCAVWVTNDVALAPATWAGIGLMLLGAAWRTWCGGYSLPGRHFHPCGPYALVRHPLHVASVLLAVGALLALPLSWPVRGAAAGVVVVLSLVRARIEDRKVLRRLHAEHQEWARTTASVWPSPGGVARAARDGRLWRGFKWTRVRGNGGARAAPVLLAVLLFLCVTSAWRTRTSDALPAEVVILAISAGVAALGTGYVLVRARRGDGGP